MNYVGVWLVLAAVTLAEVALAWVNTAPALMLALLLLLSFGKAGLIAWWFMHLRTHRPAPLRLLIPAVAIFIGFLLALLPDGLRAWTLR